MLSHGEFNRCLGAGRWKQQRHHGLQICIEEEHKLACCNKEAILQRSTHIHRMLNAADSPQTFEHNLCFTDNHGTFTQTSESTKQKCTNSTNYGPSTQNSAQKFGIHRTKYSRATCPPLKLSSYLTHPVLRTLWKVMARLVLQFPLDTHDTCKRECYACATHALPYRSADLSHRSSNSAYDHFRLITLIF